MPERLDAEKLVSIYRPCARINRIYQSSRFRPDDGAGAGASDAEIEEVVVLETGSRLVVPDVALGAAGERRVVEGPLVGKPLPSRIGLPLFAAHRKSRCRDVSVHLANQGQGVWQVLVNMNNLAPPYTCVLSASSALWLRRESLLDKVMPEGGILRL